MKQGRGLRLREQLAALGTFEIREEDKAAGVVTLQQNHAEIGHAGGVHGGERHRVRIVRLGRLRFAKPRGKKRIRIHCCGEVTVH